ncbi:MAG TPA: T9SS type A sorting domain-containing protein, partial [Bacteroidia bacterium]|nr:T9SS type A sorting domain-containing protein [Bacteroidia bacterium]
AYPEAGYAHSGWGAKNNKTLIWIDETQDKGIHVGSVEDPYDISWTNNFRSTLLAPAHTNSIAHNVIVVGDYAYISYYQDGLQIWNISNPTIPVRAGYYDTNINATYTGMFGAWGIHRPLPSGNILVSDTQNGLFVLQFNSVFPAEMVNFEADALQDRVHLRWSTESEVSCRSFMVQRSQDGKTFEDVVEVAAAGNSTQLLNYDSYDEAPLPGRSFYRLRQNDFDGNTSFGEVREVDLGKGTFNMTAYPNPSNAGDRVSIRIEALQAASAEMEVTDLMGRTLLHQDIALQPGVAELDLPSADWASGSYLLRLTAEGVRLEQKLLITR